MPGPLHGVRVLDITTTALGPFATQILGDMGADVWKIESPAGDQARGIGPSRSPGMGPFFQSVNRNKRSIVLDLKHPAANGVMHRLLERSDVFVSSVRPKALARAGLAYEEVARINPRVIYCNAVGYGSAGPYAGRPAYDDLIQAAVGLPYWQAAGGGEPKYVAAALVDRTVGMAVASAIGMALYHRERTGRGQAIEVPMFETLAQMIVGDHLHGHTFEPPLGEMGYPRLIASERKPFKTRDGYVAVMIYTDKQWTSFFRLTGREAVMDDPRFVSITGRTANIDELYRHVADVLAVRTTREGLELLESGDIPCAPLNTPHQVLEDPHLSAVGFFPQIEHPSEGKLRGFGVPSTWTDSQPEVARHVPLLGEHTRELLREAGYDDGEIEALLEAGAAEENCESRVRR